MTRLVALVALALGCDAPAPGPARGVAVVVGTPERATRASAARYSAQIVPHTRVDVAFKVGGYVESIGQVVDVEGRRRALQEGDPVEVGDTLATLRRTEYAQKVAEAKAAVAQASSAFLQAKTEHARDAELVRRGSLPGAALDASRGRRDGARAALDGARVRLEQASTALGDTRLRSPIDGVVVRRAIEVGALAAPATVAFAVADVASVKAVFGVPDTLLPRIQLGARLPVTSDAFPDVEFVGKVTRLSPSADAKGRVFEVDVTIPNADGRLKAGMVAALAIDAAADADGEGALLVPLSAVVRPPAGEGFAVFVVEGDAGREVARRRVVELGSYLGRLVPVTRGLRGDERVVVQGAGLLADGERVEVIP